MASPEDQNRACVERHVRALNDGDVDGFLDCLTDDVVVHWPRSGRAHNGKGAVRKWIDDIFSAYEQLTNEIVGIYPSGSTVVLEVVARGTQVRDLNGIPAGRVLDNPELYVYHFRDGRIREARCY